MGTMSTQIDFKKMNINEAINRKYSSESEESN